MKLDEAATQNILDTSRQWLALVDAGAFAESWAHAAGRVRPWHTRERFEAVTKKFFTEHGKPTSRNFKSITSEYRVPNSPEGEYVVVSYETKTEREEKPLREFTLMENEEGVW